MKNIIICFGFFLNRNARVIYIYAYICDCVLNKIICVLFWGNILSEKVLRSTDIMYEYFYKIIDISCTQLQLKRYASNEQQN